MVDFGEDCEAAPGAVELSCGVDEAHIAYGAVHGLGLPVGSVLVIHLRDADDVALLGLEEVVGGVADEGLGGEGSFVIEVHVYDVGVDDFAVYVDDHLVPVVFEDFGVGVFTEFTGADDFHEVVGEVLAETVILFLP